MLLDNEIFTELCSAMTDLYSTNITCLHIAFLTILSPKIGVRNLGSVTFCDLVVSSLQATRLVWSSGREKMGLSCSIPSMIAVDTKPKCPKPAYDTQNQEVTPVLAFLLSTNILKSSHLDGSMQESEPRVSNRGRSPEQALGWGFWVGVDQEQTTGVGARRGSWWYKHHASLLQATHCHR